jgi:hypothetical protein
MMHINLRTLNRCVCFMTAIQEDVGALIIFRAIGTETAAAMTSRGNQPQRQRKRQAVQQLTSCPLFRNWLLRLSPKQLIVVRHPRETLVEGGRMIAAAEIERARALLLARPGTDAGTLRGWVGPVASVVRRILAGLYGTPPTVTRLSRAASASTLPRTMRGRSHASGWRK